MVVISGTKDGIEMAKKRIDEIIKSVYEDHTTYELSVPRDLHGAIIGRYDS